MAKTVTRQQLKQFGANGASGNFGQFGSVNNGTPIKTKNIATIQALSAWLNGWQDAVVSGNKAPFLEDMNSAMYVAFYNLFYLLQEGIAEWDFNTTYFIGSLVRRPGTIEVYSSNVTDNLSNNLPPDQSGNFDWTCVYPPQFVNVNGQISLSQIADTFIPSSKIINIDASKITSIIVNSQIQSLFGGKVFGRTDASNPSAGIVGEYADLQSPLVNLTVAGQFFNLTSLLLSAGDWDITGSVIWSNILSTNNNLYGGVSLYSGNNTTDHTFGVNIMPTNTWVAGALYNVVVPRWRVNVTGPTTVYLKARAGNTSTSANGFITARRAS